MHIRSGLVGLGTAGRSLPQAVAKTTGFSFVAGADLRQEAREQYGAEFGIQTFDSVAAMCDLKDIDVVYVATPNPFHAEHAITALEHGKHVMVEKPMALTLEDCDRMIAAAEENRLKLMVAHTSSFNPPIRRMREIISSGRLGRVTQVHTLRYSLALAAARGGRN
jgi:phthalate 4,5-cis-dihydrodiol dehydrogenase